ncbi:MAG: hypothetical protein U1F10_07020 [Burkholderiales bacterium]
MRALRTVAAALVAAAVLGGCHTALLRDTDREHLCRVTVESSSESAAFAGNPWNDPAGGVAMGTGTAALAVVSALGNPVMAIFVPVALVRGIECSIGAREHPALDADFTRVLATVDGSVLPRTLEQHLDRHDARCAGGPEGARAPDAVIVLERVAVAPGCGYGDWGYSVVVTWHATRGDGRPLVATRKTGCSASGARTVDDWLADPAKARLEVEQLLDAAGEKIAADLLSDSEPLPGCGFYVGTNATIRR